jgi:hypothetical protein
MHSCILHLILGAPYTDYVIRDCIAVTCDALQNYFNCAKAFAILVMARALRVVKNVKFISVLALLCFALITFVLGCFRTSVSLGVFPAI